MLQSQKHVPLTELEKCEIINLCKTGNYTYNQLYKLYGRPRKTIWRILKKNNITSIKKINERKGKSKYDFLAQDIISLYIDECYTFPQLEKRFGISGKIITFLLEKHGYKARSNSECHRKYPINEHFFDKIDTQEKAYIIGLLYADGHNRSDSNKVILGLKESDKHILDQINNLIQPTKSLTFKDLSYIRKNKGFEKSQNQYILTIYNKHISERLNELGISKGVKSFTLTFPTWLDESLIRHFIRGYFDGDGCLFINNKNAPGVSIISTLSFCLSLKEILYHIISIKSTIDLTHNSNNNMRYINIGGRNQVMKFLDWIYKDSTIHLERKYDKYLVEKEKYEQMKILKPWIYK